MSSKWKNLIFTLFIVLILFTSIRFSCLAQSDSGLEVKYPLVNHTSLSATSTFKQYIQYIYKFLIWTAGIVLMIIILGAGISYMTSVGNPAKMKDAKERIISGILGIIVVFFSYLILSTINPEIVGKKVNFESPKIGLYLKDTQGNKIMVGDDIYDTGNFKGNFICSHLEDEDLKKITSIYIFDKKDFQGNAQEINPAEINGGCFSSSAVDPIKSVKIVWNLPGIYIWSSYKTSCSLPYLINGTVLDLNIIPALSDVEKWDEIEIKNSSSSHFGAILYEDVDFRGEGQFFMESPGIHNTAYNVSPHKSIYVFNEDFESPNVSTTLYSSPQFQEQREERDASGNNERDVLCPRLTVTSPVYKPAPLHSRYIGNLRSIKIAPQEKNKTLVILLRGVSGPLYSWKFEMAEPFTESDPDLSDNYIGRCTSTPPISPWMDWYSIYHSCATHYMVIPIQK